MKSYPGLTQVQKEKQTKPQRVDALRILCSLCVLPNNLFVWTNPDPSNYLDFVQFAVVSSLRFSDIRPNTTYYMIVHLHGMNWKDGKSKNITRNEGSSERILLDVIFDKMTFS